MGTNALGHFVTKDLIEYKDYPVALAPENQALESGCFSGGAISVDDQLMLVYTRHLEKENEKKRIYLQLFLRMGSI